MFQSIWSDIKYEYAKKENYLMRIILINIAIFVVANLAWFIQRVSPLPTFEWIDKALAMPVPLMKVIYKPWTFFTTFITHYDFFHILSNMIGLYWFGRIVEDLIGAKKILAIYILGGMVSSVTVLLFYNTIPYFVAQNTDVTIIGASGSVFAIAVAAATIAPNYSLNLLLFGPVKIKYIVAVYIFLSFIGTTGANAGGHLAHLGGAFFGFLFISSLKNGRDFGRPVYWILSLFDPKPKLKITHRNSSVKREGNETPNQDEIDRILDKINRSGYESLSKEEKQKLFKASQNQQ